MSFTFHHAGFCYELAPFDKAVDPILAQWSVALGVCNYCKLNLNIEIDMKHLLEEFEKIARTLDASEFYGFHPLDFDRSVVRDIKDKKKENIYTLKIKIKEINWEDEVHSDDSDSSRDYKASQYFDVLFGKEEGLVTETGECINNCMFVVHFCQSKIGKYFCCVEKSSDQNSPFHSFPRIIPQPHYLLYRIKVDATNMKPSKAVIAQKIASRVQRAKIEKKRNSSWT